MTAIEAPASAVGHDDDLACYVDPFIGTLGLGFTFPGAAVPYGMVQVSPDTNGLFAYSGYLYNDTHIRGFSHVHFESIGMMAGGNVPVMPTTGPITSTDPLDYQSRFDHRHEEASPGYYRVFLDTYGIDAEVTAGLRTAVHRYRFPTTERANVLIDVGRQIAASTPFPDVPADTAGLQSSPGRYSAQATVDPAQCLVMGTANPAHDGPHGYAVHFAVRCSRPFTDHGGWTARGEAARSGLTHVEGTGAGVFVTFDATTDAEVIVKVGISFVSQANALANLDAELPAGEFEFDAHRARARASWNEALGAIVVEGGEKASRRSFYTALYHAQHHPNVFCDVTGEYLGHDGEVHRVGAPGDPMPAGSTYYANFSLWDTYRGQHQLLCLIAPDRVADIARSLLAIARWGGRLPRWSLACTYPDWMPGQPVLQVLADTHSRGLVPDDAIDELYAAARALALHDDPADIYAARGYVAYDEDRGGASITLERAISDFGFSLLAHRLGHANDHRVAWARAFSWRNVFDPGCRFARPRLSDGSWLWSTHLPGLYEGFVEGSGWQYTWLVPHDVRGLADAIGAPPEQGTKFVTAQLDRFFSNQLRHVVPHLPAIARSEVVLGHAHAGNQYDPTNEHDLHAPYLYCWVGQPWKTQAVIRELQGIFTATPDGLPGNDDLGTMSAWFVWSALGFYPAVPGAPLYTLASPLFARATVAAGGRSLTIDAPEASLRARFIRRARLGDRVLEGPWFTHSDLLEAGSLHLEMSNAPDLSWATDPASAPPSMATHSPDAFG